MTDVTADQENAVIVGRKGIKLPDLSSNEWKVRLRAYDALKFFRQLWVANGLDPTTEYPYGFYNAGRPRQYNHELVIDDDKPLTVLRGSFQPRNRTEIEHDHIRNERYADYDKSAIVTGIEQHQVLVPPSELGPFTVKWSVSYNHFTGGSGNLYEAPAHQPRLQRVDAGELRTVTSLSFKPEPEDPNMDWREREALRADAFSSAIRHTLQETVDFLS